MMKRSKRSIIISNIIIFIMKAGTYLSFYSFVVVEQFSYYFCIFCYVDISRYIFFIFWSALTLTVFFALFFLWLI